MNKTALVTGGSDGVGLSLVRALADEGYEVHFVGSSEEKGLKISKALNEESQAKINFWCVDLSDLDQVKRFAKDFAKEVTVLDRLVFSAGVVMPKRKLSKQGHELTFAINYLSAYVLAHSFKPLLEKSDAARVLFVSGGGALVLKQRLDFSNLMLEKGYLAPKAAANAVHAKTALAQILAEDWMDTNIAVNAFHPGLVKSGLTRNLPWPVNRVAGFASLAMSEVSKTGVRAALSEDYADVSGHFFEGRRKKRLRFDIDYCEQLRQCSKELVS